MKPQAGDIEKSESGKGSDKNHIFGAMKEAQILASHTLSLQIATFIFGE